MIVGVKRQVDKLSEITKLLLLVMTAVIIVFFVSFLGFVIDAFIYRTDAYKEYKVILKEERNFMNEEIKIRDDKIKDIELRIELLETEMVNKSL